MDAMIIVYIVGFLIVIWVYKVWMPQQRKSGSVKRKNAPKRRRAKLKTSQGEYEVMGGERVRDDRHDFLLILRSTFSGYIIKQGFSEDSIKPKDIFQVLVGSSTDRPCFEVIEHGSVDMIQKELEYKLKEEEERDVMEKLKKEKKIKAEQKELEERDVMEKLEKDENFKAEQKRFDEIKQRSFNQEPIKKTEPLPENTPKDLPMVVKEKEDEGDILICPVKDCGRKCHGLVGLTSHLRSHKKIEPEDEEQQ